MAYSKLLTIQDISCVGQCSLTVALPIISACGIETCILPSAVLSTHTAGFKNFTFRDLTDDMPSIMNHWLSEGINFETIYTGYLGSTKQISYVADIFDQVGTKTCIKIVDPAMADNGKLYPIFDMAYVEAMKTLIAKADYIIPNLTEACFLTDVPYQTEYDQQYIETILNKLTDLGCKAVIFTGISYKENRTGVVIFKDGVSTYYEHEKLPVTCHGTGDIYASAFVGALVRGKTPYNAAKIAADYTVACIKETLKLDNHWYGAAFEPVLPKLIEMLNRD